MTKPPWLNISLALTLQLRVRGKAHRNEEGRFDLVAVSSSGHLRQQLQQSLHAKGDQILQFFRPMPERRDKSVHRLNNKREQPRIWGNAVCVDSEYGRRDSNDKMNI